MKRTRFRFLLTFLAGILATVVVLNVSASLSSFASTRYEDLSLFTSVINLVRHNYVEPIDERDLIKSAVSGILGELDPHSSFLDPEAYREMQVDTRGEFHGLGIEITKRKDGFIEVVSPIEGTPASKAGILSRDQIVSICPTEVPEDWSEPCQGTKNMTLFDAVRHMRGRRGTKITIEIYREAFEKPEPFEIVRDVVKVVSVSSRMLEPGYGYVRIRAFQERTIDDLTRALQSFRDESGGSLDGLVLDMRDNPGGLLDQAVKVANKWLTDGLVVYTQGRAESQRQEFRANAEGTESDYPITILVNEGTASASEIVAGALQDQRRALVIGQRTFGKGSVQTVFPLVGDAGLRLTTALYYTPAGRSIQEVGIDPDISVSQPLIAAAGEPVKRRLRERDLERHFTHQEAEPGTDESAGAESEETDVQLARALEVLKSRNYFERLRRMEGESMQARAPGEATPATP